MERASHQTKAFYSEKVSHLKNADLRKWWSVVNKLSSKSGGMSAIIYEAENEVISGLELATFLFQ